MSQLTTIQQIAIWILPVLFAITIHEAAHGWMANRLGDSTAKLLGRLTLNPIKHIDLVGTIIVPVVILLLTQFHFVFGWAKPVPINGANLRNPRRDMAWVAIAGPGVNFIMALLWALGLKLSTLMDPLNSSPAQFLFLTAQAGIMINLILAYLNLIPIPPLDGSRVVAAILPRKTAYYYNRIEPFGFFILIILMISGLLSMILSPLILGTAQLILTLIGL